MAESDVTKTHLEITVRGQTHNFRIPTFKDEISIGMVARKIRRQFDPDGLGEPTGLDYTTFNLCQYAAQIKVLLESSSGAQWLWSPEKDADGKPTGKLTIDPANWGPDRVAEVAEIGVEFSEKLDRFRSGRTDQGNGEVAPPVAT